MTDRYHHGDLRRALLARTADEVARAGVAAISLRAIAAAEGVSHTAPRHHFGSREGLLTALAAEGHAMLAETLAAVRESTGDYLEMGIAYVRFAEEHPGHFAVMFDPDVVIADDPALAEARRRAFAELGAGLATADDAVSQRDLAAAAIAGWALMHGLVMLHRGETLERAEVLAMLGRPSLEDLARRAGSMLYGSSGTAPGSAS